MIYSIVGLFNHDQAIYLFIFSSQADRKLYEIEVIFETDKTIHE